VAGPGEEERRHHRVGGRHPGRRRATRRCTWSAMPSPGGYWLPRTSPPQRRR
jgi:hypothetical protein